MCIIRSSHDKETPYVVLNKKSLWDSTLSLQSVGLWARIMSRPDDWKFRVSELAKSCNKDEDTINKYLRELIDAGYAYRSQKNDPTTGKFGPIELVVFETKKSMEEIKEMFPEGRFPEPEPSPPVQHEPGKPPVPVISALLSNKEEILSNKNPPFIPPLKSGESPKPCSKPEKRKRLEVEYVKRAERVATTPSQHDALLNRASGDESLVAKWYNRLSEWKINKNLDGGTRDYLAITTWVISAVAEAPMRRGTAAGSSLGVENNNKDFAKKVKDKYVSNLSNSFLI